MGEWIAVENNRNFWSPSKEGDQIEGKLVGIEDGTYGKKYILQIKKDGKEELITMPSHKLLQGRLSVCEQGDMVRVIYKGTQPPKVRGENPLMLYDVFYKRD